MKALSRLTAHFVLIPFLSYAQPGEIRGVAYEITPDKPVPFATVAALRDSTTILTTSTDMNGNFTLKPLESGTYSIKAASVGYAPVLIKDVKLAEGKISFVNIVFSKATELKSVEVVENKIPLISKGQTAVQKTVTYEEIQASPLRDVNNMGSSSQGVFHRDEGRTLNVRGSRSDGTAYYVDGIKVRGGNVPASFKDNTEEYAAITENQFNDAIHHPLSTFSIDVDAASYSNVRRFIMQGVLPPVDAVRIEEMINYFSYRYGEPDADQPFSISTEVSGCPWNSKHSLVRIALKGRMINAENLPPGNLVFLIDVSGSMDQPNKLPLVKRSLHLLVNQLRPEDRVAIVVYAGNAGLVLPSTKGSEKEKILDAIENLQAGGSTAGGAGIELAYKTAAENFKEKGNNRVILATDGDFNVGISSDDELVRFIEQKRDQGIFLTVLGFGTGNYKDAKMEKLADKGNGNFSYVDNILEANKVLVKELGATLYTIAKDVKIQVEFNPSKVKAYKLVGYENRMLEARDFNDDKKDAGEIGAGSAVTALYEIVPSESEEKFNLIDPLRYQHHVATADSLNDELLTVKLRYKEPAGKESKLIIHPLDYRSVEIKNTTDDFRFASSVAYFGMILRNSQFIESADYKSVIELAKSSKGTDEEGYRAEFIRLVELAHSIDSKNPKMANGK